MFVLNRTPSARMSPPPRGKRIPRPHLRRRLPRVERRHANQGEHLNRRQRLAGGRCDVPQTFRGGAGRRAYDHWRRAIQSRDSIETNADLARPEAPLQGVDECCIPPTGATTPFRTRGAGHSGLPNRSDALRRAGSPAYLPWRAGPTSHWVARGPSTCAPHCSTVSSGRGDREPRAVAVTNRVTSEIDSHALNGHRLGRQRGCTRRA